ncbi:4-alpha-L-fucosyltransferase (glycosyl transferase family 56) [Flavobacterium sp. 1]|uniref:TDP-N-acetylfucosamine:lipid II N-acetylfucosaminyltransferase n=1 Tax=Flavobacterium sp. 1 TaxID=2035200 RepID=UPI000C24D8DD|nr:TDP-N-acetylfucosamine:lipid II N-acetylfucosaminyltransferase [Flavobacterium sp. 1]PJJ10958.1 4-alpha-L-fucosyltransferase (glycosyl transferase family 56) [Flavobacterium sp. 1]
MNYHIMIQDKFLDSFIADVYAIGEENNNVFWFRGDKGETNYLTTDKLIEYLGHDKLRLKNKLQSLNPTDTIFIHWYDKWIADLVYDLPNKLIVFFWGGEMYEEPFWHHAKWIYDKKTYSIIKKQSYPKIIWQKNIFKTIRTIKNVLRYPVIVRQQYEHKKKQVERIDYIICGQFNTGEIEKVNELYPTFKAKHLAGYYDLNFDLANEINIKAKTSVVIKILVGNSATEANNHLEAFEKLKRLKDVEIYCVLSYGSDYYKRIVMLEGKRVFGNFFHPITDFMPRKEYVEFVNEMDVVYMYHNRSQAWGNIVTALTFGKPVFIKNENVLKKYITAIGIKTYDADLIGQCNLESIITEEKKNFTDNIEKLKKTISNEVRLNNLKEIMTVYAR